MAEGKNAEVAALSTKVEKLSILIGLLHTMMTDLSAKAETQHAKIKKLEEMSETALQIFSFLGPFFKRPLRS